MKKTTLSVLILCVMLFITVCTAYATDDTICGCVQRVTGNLRIVGCTNNCLPSENAVQLAVPPSPTGIIHGSVDENGLKTSGEGFTSDLITGNSGQVAVITFDTPFAEAPDCTVTSMANEYSCFIRGLTPTTTELDVQCWTPIAIKDNNVIVDIGFFNAAVAFSFICIQ